MNSQTSTKLTYEDYLALPDDGRRYAQRRGVEGLPDLVIEALSEPTRKMDEILKSKRSEQFTSPLLPGFSLDVRDVFAE